MVSTPTDFNTKDSHIVRCIRFQIDHLVCRGITSMNYLGLNNAKVVFQTHVLFHSASKLTSNRRTISWSRLSCFLRIMNKLKLFRKIKVFVHIHCKTILAKDDIVADANEKDGDANITIEHFLPDRKIYVLFQQSFDNY